MKLFLAHTHTVKKNDSQPNKNHPSQIISSRKLVDREGVKGKLKFMDEGKGRRGRRGNISKSRRIYRLGRGRDRNWEKECGEFDEDLEEGGSDEGGPQEGEGEMADSSVDSSPGGSRIFLPPPPEGQARD